VYDYIDTFTIYDNVGEASLNGKENIYPTKHLVTVEIEPPLDI